MSNIENPIVNPLEALSLEDLFVVKRPVETVTAVTPPLISVLKLTEKGYRQVMFNQTAQVALQLCRDESPKNDQCMLRFLGDRTLLVVTDKPNVLGEDTFKINRKGTVSSKDMHIVLASQYGKKSEEVTEPLQFEIELVGEDGLPSFRTKTGEDGTAVTIYFLKKHGVVHQVTLEEAIDREEPAREVVPAPTANSSVSEVAAPTEVNPEAPAEVVEVLQNAAVLTESLPITLSSGDQGFDTVLQ